MFDPSTHHAEPFGEALSHSSQHAAQMVSLVAAAAEVALRRRALHAARQTARDEQQRRQLREEESAFRAGVQARWAPALDARWLAQADLLQAGRVWGAAAPWADADPQAATALRRAEERLRTLHPYAMGRYDRLRGEGASALDAMSEVANLFSREPHVRPGQSGPVRRAVEAGVLGAGTAPGTGATAEGSGEPASGQDLYEGVERRGREVVARLQARALHERGVELSPGELVTALETSTSLPTEIIARLVRAEGEERVSVAAERARAADLGHAATVPSARVQMSDLKAGRRNALAADTAGAHASADRTAAQLAAESFPCTTADGIRAAVADQLQSAQSAGRPAYIQDKQRISVSP